MIYVNAAHAINLKKISYNEASRFKYMSAHMVGVLRPINVRKIIRYFHGFKVGLIVAAILLFHLKLDGLDGQMSRCDAKRDSAFNVVL